MTRTVEKLVDAVRAVEGAGFVVHRPFPIAGLEQVDPFLLLDEMGPLDLGPGQAQGAPDHPHRGFETVTYLLEGAAQHKDSAGNHGTLGPGDVQWMTAGAGVVHSEMPAEHLRRNGGRMHGFQLWVNLPKRDKMMAPRYQELPAARIPKAQSDDGKVQVTVLAGESLGARAVIETRTPITYVHARLLPGGVLDQALPTQHNALVYVFDGAGRVGGTHAKHGQMALLHHDGDVVRVENPADAGKAMQVLILSGQPIKEPMARFGPFVMNTRSELIQAAEDYEAGRMGRIRT